MSARRFALRGALLAGALSAIVPLASEARLSAGAGRAVIDVPMDMLPVQGFGVQLDPLNVRVVLFEDGGAKAAIASVDLTSINDDGVAKMKQIIAQATGAKAEDILVDASHTFSSPHMPMPGNAGGTTEAAPAGQADRNARYVASVYDAVKQAATSASTSLKPARIGIGTGYSNVNVNRNMLTADGWWLGADEQGPSDKSVSTVRIDDDAGAPIAILFNYAVQSAVMDQAKGKNGSKLITSDLGGAAAKYVEDQYPGVVGMFLPGAGGDQFPAYKSLRYVLDKDGKVRTVDIGEAAYPLVTLQGERLGTEVVRVRTKTAATATTGSVRVINAGIELTQQERPRSLQQIHATKSYDYKINGTTKAPYVVLQVGDLAIVGVQVELSAVTGKYIRDHSPFRNTLVVTMVNGAAKYLPDAGSYRDFTYEAQNSSYGPGSAEKMAEDILKTLKDARKSR